MIKNNLYKDDLNKIKISIASPNQVLSFSSGEVTTSDTLNYNTLNTVNNGLFCDKIFGSSKLNSCSCGKLLNYSKQNLTCTYCKVDVSSFRARRYRIGHLKLNGFYINTLFFKSAPYFLSILLNLSLVKIENILYNNYYLVIFPYKSLKVNDVISFNNYIFYLKKYKNKFFAETSFDAINLAVNYIDYKKYLKKDKKFLFFNRENFSSFSYKKIYKRYKLFKYLFDNNLSLKNIFLKILPILPPDLRPIVKLSDSKLISSDLNELYKRLIIRNFRLNKITSTCFNNIIINNEKRLIQSSINDLFFNSKIKNIFSDYSDKKYKSITDNLKGKFGIFRQNLLGKRVDFSGRAVIVSGPNLNVDECSISKYLALELFRPFVYSKLLAKNNNEISIKRVKYEVDNKTDLAFSVLNDVVKNNYILLNRAPTLHKLSIQSFKIYLNNDNVIKLNPLVCSVFNADFDGDQMAVHIPVSLSSKNEFKTILLSSNNILLPSNGEISISPTQDIILGIYYSTNISDNLNRVYYFKSLNDIFMAYESGIIKLNSKIFFRYKKYSNSNFDYSYNLVCTTYGRVSIFNILPKGVDFSLINKVLRKKDINDLLGYIFCKFGNKEVVNFSNKLMKLGFTFATQSGISISMDDMLFYKNKIKLIEKFKLLNIYYNIDYLNGLLNFFNKREKVLDIWENVSELIYNFTIELYLKNKKFNSLYAMIDSGARGSDLQIKQICCMRGIMNYKNYGILEVPVLNSLRDGLNVLEYFYFSHSSRKTLADTALKTSVAGYLTRKLVEVSNSILIFEFDCFTTSGILFRNLTYKGVVIENFYDRILGRVVLNDVYSSLNSKLLFKKNTLINQFHVDILKNENINILELRSPVTCVSKSGICCFCYGIDLSKNKLVTIGTPVGIIAAQSIGEPGTQLTMRTFHTGGAYNKKDVSNSLYINNNGIAEFFNLKYVLNSNSEKVVVSQFGKVHIKDTNNHVLLESFNIPYSSILFITNNSCVKPGDIICTWDFKNKLIVSETSGYVKYENLIENLNYVKKFDNILGIYNIEILKNVEKFPILLKVCADYDNCNIENASFYYKFAFTGFLYFFDKNYINSGDILYKNPVFYNESFDITGGLPKIIELFEARVPKNNCFLSEFDGYVFFIYKKKYKYLIIKDNNNNNIFKKSFPSEKEFIVNEGSFVSKGDILTTGDINPHDVLKIYGINELLSFYLSEIKNIYYSQGVKINDKHIEVIVSEMLSKVVVVNSSHSKYISGDIVDKKKIYLKNKNLFNNNKNLIKYNFLLSGITKTSLNSESFLSSISFQNTSSILNTSSVFNKIDYLKTLKADVMLGHLIPSGTGYYSKIFKK